MNRTLYGFPKLDVTRDLLFNLGGMNSYFYWILWSLLIFPVLFLLVTLIRRRKIWNKGPKEKRSDHFVKRIFILIKYVFLHKKIIKYSLPGLIHVFIFYGFLLNFLSLLYAYLIVPIMVKFYSVNLFYGQRYLIWALVNDLSAFFIFVGISLAFYRRYFLKPSCLDNTKNDKYALILFIAIPVCIFFAGAARIALNGIPDFEIWAPVSYGLAHLFQYLPGFLLEIGYQLFFWLYILLFLVMIAALASGKTGHIVFAILNILKCNLKNESVKTKYQLKLQTADEYDINKTKSDLFINDFSNKARLDLDACVRCGRCQDVCPSWLVEKKLSPKKVIMQLKKAMLGNLNDDKPLLEEYIISEELWACTLCGACMEVCPLLIEHIPKIINLRSFDLKNNYDKKDYLSKIHAAVIKQKAELEVITEINNDNIQILPDDDSGQLSINEESLLEEGADEESTPLPENLEQSNPVAEESSRDNIDIIEENSYLSEILEIKCVQLVTEDLDFDYLYFAGCGIKNDEKSRKSAAAFLETAALAAGYKIGVLGDMEACCGDAALRAGEEGLFRKLAFKNIELFDKYKVKKIITSCPHGYNVLKKEYRLLAKDHYNYEFQVYHYVEILCDMIKNRKISFKQDNYLALTYHDPCFLGRYNEIYKAPRRILRSIPGAFCLEMRQSKSKSLCCGGGAVQLMIDKENGAGFANYRAKEAHLSGAEIVVTACARCNRMLNNAFNNLHYDNIKAVDLAEIVYNAVDR